MRILLARHGNTFGPGDKVVWVGRETDLPLVAAGIEQAHRAAAALGAQGGRPGRVFCAPLRRTHRFAEIVAEDLGLAAPTLDARLSEIDYGPWAGKTAAEIEAVGQGALLEAWNAADIWPQGAGWRTSETEIAGNIRGFFADLLRASDRDEAVLAVSSNGFLRFVPRVLGLVAPETPPRSYHMKTGRLSVLEAGGSGIALRGWNLDPADFRL